MKKQRARFTHDELVPDAIRWVNEEEEAQERRDYVKLLVLIACGVARPAELAATSYNSSPRALARAALNLGRLAAAAAEKNPKLVEITRRMAKHNPIGARRIAVAMLEAKRERYDAVTVAIYAWSYVMGLG